MIAFVTVLLLNVWIASATPLEERAATDCKPIACTKQECPYGWEHVNGCPTCNCVWPTPRDNQPADGCPTRACTQQFCPHGWQFDSDGCRTCNCLEPTPHKRDSDDCKPIACQLRYCQYGLVQVNGCPTCQCREATPRNTWGCSNVNCLIYCPYGNVKDSNGCITCDCLDPTPRDTRSVCADRPRCRKYCDVYGKDDDGCDRCTCCQPRACPAIACPSGKYERDEQGCTTCNCIE